MSVTLWIVLAFLLGVVFGRLTSRSSSGRAGAPGSFGPPVAGAPGFGVAGGSVPPSPVAGNPNGAFRVTLVDRGPNLVNTIKAVRAVTRLGLADAKNAAEGAPRELVRVDSAEQAQAIVRAFQGIATVRVDGPAAGALNLNASTAGAGLQESQ